jgi:hypothetical protein
MSSAALQLTDWSNCINDGCTRKADRTTTSRVVRNKPTRPFPEAVTAAYEQSCANGHVIKTFASPLPLQSQHFSRFATR